MKTVKITLVPDGPNDYKAKYELDGFVGTECDGISQLMGQLGTVSDHKVTDDAYTHEIPIPVPNQTSN